MNLIHAHPTEVYQLAAAVIGAAAAAWLLYLADKARRIYRASGENDPDMLATAAANIRDEGFRLSKHMLFVVIGVVSIIMEPPYHTMTERETVVRWILIVCSSLMMVQSFMVWRDRVSFEQRASQRRNRRIGDTSHKHDGRRQGD